MIKDQGTGDEEDANMSEQLTSNVKNSLGGIKELKTDFKIRNIPKVIKKGFSKDVTKKKAMKMAGKSNPTIARF